MASTKRIDLFIRPTSTITKDGAIEYAYNRANERDESVENNLTDYAHYYDVTDTRDGSKYMVFGTNAQKILDLPKMIDLLDKKEFMRGYTDEIIVSNADGTSTIELSNICTNYNVLLTVKDNLQAIARVEDETENSFKIVLYDAETYAEDKIKLDCSEQNVTVNYVVAYE